MKTYIHKSHQIGSCFVYHHSFRMFSIFHHNSSYYNNPMSTFAQQLWDKTDLVIKHSIERRKQLEEFVNALSKRIDVEESYAKGLEETAKIAQKVREGEDSVSAYSFTSFKLDCSNRSSQSRNFGKSLRQQILTPLKQLISGQHQQSKQMEKDWKKLDKELHELQQNIIKNRNRYDQQYADVEQTLMLNQISLQSQKIIKEKRIKIISKTHQLMKNLGQLQRNYQKSIADYNNFITLYYLQLQKLLDAYQKQEQARLFKQQQNIMKMLVFETSMTKNFEYDINNITKKLETVKKHDDIQEFISKNKTGRERQKQQNKNLKKNILGQSLYRIINKEHQRKIGLEGNHSLRQYIEKKFKGEFTEDTTVFQKNKLEQFEKLFKIVSTTWQGQPLTEQLQNQIKVLLRDEFNRLALWMYFHQYQLTHCVTIPQESYQGISSIVKILLEACNQPQDVFIARKITNLAFTLYTANNDNQRKYLHTSLNDSTLFSMIDYWKAAVFETVQQQLFLHFGDKIEEQIQMRYMSLVLGQLAMFCHQMVLLGFPSKEVRHIIGWYCRLYDIPDDQNRDLARTVNASVKRYKQLFRPETLAPVEPTREKRIVSFDIGQPGSKQKSQKPNQDDVANPIQQTQAKQRKNQIKTESPNDISSMKQQQHSQKQQTNSLKQNHETEQKEKEVPKQPSEKAENIQQNKSAQIKPSESQQQQTEQRQNQK